MVAQLSLARIHLNAFMGNISKMIYMINPQKQRFYWLMLQQDILDVWCVRKVYGSLSNKHCRDIWIPYPSRIEASQALTEVEYVRRQRGYIYSDMYDADYFALKPQTIKDVLAGK